MLVLSKVSLGTYFLSRYIKRPSSFKEYLDKDTLIPIVISLSPTSPLSSSVLVLICALEGVSSAISSQDLAGLFIVPLTSP
jgi:hypothetical protein